jgi:hypothetical protein
MRKRGLGFLAAVTLALVAVMIWTLTIGEVGVSLAAPSTPALPGFADRLGEVASLAVTRDGFSETFTRDGDAWLAADKGNYPAASAKISQIVRSMADLTLVEAKTQKPELYPRLEVEDPGKGKSALVTVKDRAGKTLAELIVGKRRYDRLGAGNDGVYVRKPGEVQSWLARGSLDVSGIPSSWLDRRILDIPDKRIAKVVLTQPDGARLVLSRAAPDAKFAVEGAAADTKYRSDTATAEPAMALETLDLDDVAPAAKMPVPMQGVASASFTTFDGLTVDLRVLDRDKQNWVTIKASGTGPAEAEAKAINQRVANWSYEIPRYKAERLQTKFADLLEPAKKTP